MAFVLYGTLNEIIVHFFIFTIKLNNTMPFSHLYGLVTFLILGFFYVCILNGFIFKRITYTLVIIYAVFYLVNSLFIQNIYIYPSVARTIGAILIILFALSFFIKVMQEASIEKLHREPLIWINLAILIYYSGNFFYYFLFNIILDYSREFSKLTVIYYSVLNAAFYLLIAVGFWRARPIVKKNMVL